MLFDSELSLSARAVYGVLARYVFQGTTVRIGQRRIAGLLGIHPETVNVAIHELEERKHIGVRGKGKSRRFYHLCSPVFGQKQRAGFEVGDRQPERRSPISHGKDSLNGGDDPWRGPEANIDLAELEKLYSLQCTDEEVAAFFGVSTRTIERRRQVAEVPRNHGPRESEGPGIGAPQPVSAGSAGNIAAAIFLAKNLLGYRDVGSIEHSGPAGGPIQLAAKPNLSQANR